MKLSHIIAGIILFLLSSTLADLVLQTGFSLSIGGTEYAVDVVRKFLDAIAGSLIVWGILDFKKKPGRNRR